MRSDLLCTCQGDRVEGIIHKTSQNSRRLTRLSVETALSASLCPFALDPFSENMRKWSRMGQQWVNLRKQLDPPQAAGLFFLLQEHDKDSNEYDDYDAAVTS